MRLIMIGAIVLLTIFPALASAQDSKSSKCEPARNNQSVYFNFDHYDKKSGKVWLELWNNTEWVIRIPVAPSREVIFKREFKNGEVIDALYELEPYDPTPAIQLTDKKGRKYPPDEPTHPPVPKVSHGGDLTATYSIGAGKTVRIKVPTQHLARNVALFLPLKFSWESGSVHGTEPAHRVYFRGIDLPKEVQKQIP